MYSIQKYRARQFILKILKHKDISIEYDNGIPIIGGTKNIYHKFAIKYYKIVIGQSRIIIRLEHICYCANIYNIAQIDNIVTHIVMNIFKIYGLDYTYDIYSKVIRFPTIQHNFIFSVDPFGGMEIFNVNDFAMEVPDNDNIDTGGMLLFLIDPLEAIQQIKHKPKHSMVQEFFEYYKDTLIQQDKDFVLKYLLITYLTDYFVVVDIVHLIMNNIIELLLFLPFN